MKYKVVGKRGDIPFTVSSEEIADAMGNHCGSGEVRFLEYMYDETGRQVIGIKGLAVWVMGMASITVGRNFL